MNTPKSTAITWLPLAQRVKAPDEGIPHPCNSPSARRGTLMPERSTSGLRGWEVFVPRYPPTLAGAAEVAGGEWEDSTSTRRRPFGRSSGSLVCLRRHGFPGATPVPSECDHRWPAHRMVIFRRDHVRAAMPLQPFRHTLVGMPPDVCPILHGGR